MADPGSDFEDSTLNVSETHMKTKPILSQHDKYRKAFHVAQKLSTVVSESPMREFNEKLAILEKLLEMWEQGNEVILSIASEVDITGRPLDIFPLPYLMKLSAESFKYLYSSINFSAFNTFTVGGNAHTSESIGGGGGGGGGECSGNGDIVTAPNANDGATTSHLEGAQSSGSTEDDRTSLRGCY